MADLTPGDWPLYRYKGTLVRAKDGDTVVIRISAGFDIYVDVPVRLVGYNAPELHGPHAEAGRQATAALTSLLDGTPLFIRTLKAERSFERYLAQVFLMWNGQFTDVAELMKARGFDVPQGQ